MSTETGDRAALISPVIGHLRAFALTLDDDRKHADNCVGRTIINALRERERIEPETDVRLSLFTFLYAEYFFRPENGGSPKFGGVADQVPTSPSRLTQLKQLSPIDFRAALLRLDPAQRAALILVGPAGFSFVEAARISNCTVETCRSRVGLARTGLRDMLIGVPPAEVAHTKRIRDAGLRAHKRRSPS